MVRDRAGSQSGYCECSLCGAQFRLDHKRKEETQDTFKLHLKAAHSPKTGPTEDRYYTCEAISPDDVNSSWKYRVCGHKRGHLLFETLHADHASLDQECHILDSLVLRGSKLDCSQQVEAVEGVG
jgi:hypothetical protein